MSVARQRKEASKRIALAIQARYRKLVEANGENEIVVATSDLAMCMYENVEFIINVLRHYGGLEARFEPLTSKAANDPLKPPAPLPDISALVNEPVKADCICPPLEAGIIGYKHMTSCPQFEPAE